MIQAIRDRLEKDEDGFTLIELLVVVIIIGILAAIAIPTFLNQRAGAGDAAAKSDLRNGAIAAETSFTATGVYPTNAELIATSGPGAGNFKKSANVTMNYAQTGGGTGYCMDAVGAPSATVWVKTNTVGSVVQGTACASATAIP